MKKKTIIKVIVLNRFEIITYFDNLFDAFCFVSSNANKFTERFDLVSRDYGYALDGYCGRDSVFQTIAIFEVSQ